MGRITFRTEILKTNILRFFLFSFIIFFFQVPVGFAQTPYVCPIAVPATDVLQSGRMLFSCKTSFADSTTLAVLDLFFPDLFRIPRFPLTLKTPHTNTKSWISYFSLFFVLGEVSFRWLFSEKSVLVKKLFFLLFLGKVVLLAKNGFSPRIQGDMFLYRRE